MKRLLLITLTITALGCHAQKRSYYHYVWDSMLLVTNPDTFMIQGPALFPVMLEVPEGKQFLFMFSEYQLPAPTLREVITDNRSPNLIYSGSWQHRPDANGNTCLICGWWDNSASWPTVPGSKVSYSYTGTLVEIWAEQKTAQTLPPQGQHGIMIVTTDTDPPTEISLRAENRGPDMVPDLKAGRPSFSRLLPYGQHTITIELKDNTGPIVIDFIKTLE